MNRNQVILIVVPFLLIFGYQNCQKSNFDPAVPLINPSKSMVVSDVQNIVLANEKLERLQFKFSEQITNGTTSKYTGTSQSVKHDVDLTTGTVYVTRPGQDDLVAVKYCVTFESLKEINQLLYSDSICKSSLIRQDTVCAQVIQEGYASLLTSREEFELGSATDSCGSRKIDLCKNSELVKAWIEKTKSQAVQSSCSTAY